MLKVIYPLKKYRPILRLCNRGYSNQGLTSLHQSSGLLLSLSLSVSPSLSLSLSLSPLVIFLLRFSSHFCRWLAQNGVSMSFGRWSQTQEPVFLFLSVFFWRILVKSFIRHGLVSQGVAAVLLCCLSLHPLFSLHQTSSSPSLLRAFDSADFSYPIVTSIRHPCLLKDCCCWFFFNSEINCFFVCVWGVRTIICFFHLGLSFYWRSFFIILEIYPSLNYFCCLLSSIRYGSWCVGFILSLAVSILSRFFVVSFFPFFLSFLRRILAMSSCCCCDFWDCLGGVCNLPSSVPFRCWIFLLRNFFWFCASITSLRFFLFCFCLVFVFVFSPSLIFSDPDK